MIRAVIFDLFETLVSELDFSVRRAGSLASQLGVDETAYKREWKLRRPEIVLGRCSFQDALAEIGSKLGGVIDAAILERLRAERLEQKATVLGKVQPEVLAAVSELRRSGLKLALVTNSFPEDVESWKRSPLHSFFDVAVFSCAARLVKPDPAIYLAACTALEVMPQHALFVGDGADDELNGARAAGLTAVRALWFASKLPNTTIRPGETGLWRISQVLDVALAA